MNATDTEQRVSKQFWAIDDFWNVVRATGYACPPSTEHWWVPELGYTLTVGHHLFDDFEEAKTTGLRKLSSAIEDLKRSYNRLLDAKESE